MNRRDFLRRCVLLAGPAVLVACAPTAPKGTPSPASIATVEPAAPGGGAPPTAAAQASATALSPTATAGPTLAAAAPATALPTRAPATVAPPSATPVPTVTPAPSSTAAALLGRVALVKTPDRAEGVRRAIDLLGAGGWRGRPVLVKPNFNSADPAPGSTHPDVLRALLTRLLDGGAGPITIGDRSGMGNTRAVMQQVGALALAKELGCTAVVYDELDANAWVARQSRDYHWSRGFAVPKLLLDAEMVVSTCNLKTHRYGGHFTLSLKNSVGFAAKQVGGAGYNYMTELHNSQYQRHMIAEINQVYQPGLIVMDGVEGFADGGPDTGRRIQPGVVLAATDRIALDAVGVAILRLFGTNQQVSRGRVFEQDQIARAVELGLGVTGPEQIEIVTADQPAADFAAQLRPLLT